MRLNRIVSFAVGVALLGLPGLVAGAGSASAENEFDSRYAPLPKALGTAAYETRFEQAMSVPGTPVYDSPHQVGGFLVGNVDGTDRALTGQAITLLGKASKSGSLKVLDTGVTDGEGLVVFDRTARNFIYRLSYAGGTIDSASFGPSNSKLINVKVRRKITDKVVKKNNKITYKGRILPAFGKKTAFLERKTCDGCKWKTVDKERTSKKGNWSFAAPAPGSVGKTWFYRVKAPGDKKYATNYSQGIEVFLVSGRSTSS